MKMMCGYLKPTSGSASVMGYDIVSESLEVRKRIGYLPEHNPLYLDMYVREYLEFVASIHRIKDVSKRINELIDMTGLEKEQHKLIGMLSKGYRQRVGIAQAIIHDPAVLILDEPTSGLDMNQLEEIRALIRTLGKEKTVIFSSHIMQEVQALCSRVIIINDGRLVADDPIDQLQERLQGGYRIFVEWEKAPREVAGLLGIKGVAHVETNGNRSTFTLRGQHDVRGDIFRAAVSQNLVILEMKREEVNMEAVFRQLTKNNPAYV
jgi:ABC-2 type transport system ATP-binding protein